MVDVVPVSEIVSIYGSLHNKPTDTFSRYTFFFFLYPLGAGSEAILVYRALPYAAQFSVNYYYFLWAILIAYAPGRSRHWHLHTTERSTLLTSIISFQPSSSCIHTWFTSAARSFRRRMPPKKLCKDFSQSLSFLYLLTNENKLYLTRNQSPRTASNGNIFVFTTVCNCRSFRPFHLVASLHSRL